MNRQRQIIALAILALTGGVYASPGDDDCVGNCGGGDTIPYAGNAYAGAAAGAIAGAAAGANASNKNLIGVGVGVTNRNTNVGMNSQGQALHNANDLTNRNYMEGQRQDQGQDQTQGQSQQQRQNSKQANRQVMQYNEANKMEYSGGYKLKNTPNPYAVAPPPSAPCYIGVAGSYTAAGLGIAVSGSVYDKGCEVRETVRLGYSSSNEQTRMLADQVIQSKLLEYIDEDVERQLEEKRAEIKRDTDPFAWQNR